MEKPRFFFKRKEATTNIPSQPVNVKKWFRAFGITLLGVLIVSYFAIKIFGIEQRLVRNWSEIVFAYDKPEIIKPIMTQYEQKEAAVEQEFLTGKPDQKLLDAIKTTVAQQMQQQQSNSFR